MCCCLPTLRQFFRHVAPSWIGESKGASSADSAGRLKTYALRTFGGSGPARATPRQRRGSKSQQLDTFMMLDDERDLKTSLDGAGWRADSRFGATTDIRGGREPGDGRSLEEEGVEFNGDFESDKDILTSKIVRVESTRI